MPNLPDNAHARCSTCGATDPRDPDKWYCSNGFHAPSPVEAGILALLRFHRSQVHYTHQSRNEVASLDAAIEALTRLGVGVDGGWQPVETAPKDGSTILIYSTDGDEYIIDTAVWNNGIWASACNPMNALVTHWRPLPSPPSPSPEPAPTDSRGEG